LLLDIKLGDRQVRPSENQQHLAAAGAAGLVLGVVLDSRWLKIGGALGLACAAWSVYQDVALTVQPEAMNAHFVTGGRASALSPGVSPAVLAGLRWRAASSSARSYGPRALTRSSR
jgi:hypothetical protein